MYSLARLGDLELYLDQYYRIRPAVLLMGFRSKRTASACTICGLVEYPGAISYWSIHLFFCTFTIFLIPTLYTSSQYTLCFSFLTLASVGVSLHRSSLVKLYCASIDEFSSGYQASTPACVNHWQSTSGSGGTIDKVQITYGTVHKSSRP